MPTCEANLCIEAAERPRLYSVGRSRSDGRMPSLVGDCSQCFKCWPGAALLYTRYFNSGCVWNRTVSCLPT